MQSDGLTADLGRWLFPEPPALPHVQASRTLASGLGGSAAAGGSMASFKELRGTPPNLVSVRGRRPGTLGEAVAVLGGQGGQACLVGRPEQPVVVADDGVEILAEDAGGGEVDRVE